MCGSKRRHKNKQIVIKKNIKKYGELTCEICKEPIVTTYKPLSFTLDHILPKSRGGTIKVKNLQVAHYTCNQIKKDRYET